MMLAVPTAFVAPLQHPAFSLFSLSSLPSSIADNNLHAIDFQASNNALKLKEH